MSRGSAVSVGVRLTGGAGLAAILATARLELSLALRSKGFWILQVILLAPAFLAFPNDAGAGAYQRYAGDQLRQLVAFGLLLLPLLVLPSLSRARGVRGDLAFTTTHDSLSHALGTLLGVYAWLVPSLLMHLLARWALGKFIGGQASWTLLTVGPWTALASLTLGLGLLACLSVLLRRTLPILLVWLGLWFFALSRLGGLYGGSGTNLPLIDSMNVLYEGLSLSPSVALGLAKPLVTGLATWFALLGAALLGLWLILLPRFDARRADRWRPAPIALAVLAAGAAAWAYLSFGAEVRAQAPVSTPRSVQLDEWQVLARNLEATFAPNAATPIEGTVLLTLAPVLSDRDESPPTTLVLRLRPGMTATVRSMGTSGTIELSATRAGDSVIVDLADTHTSAGGTLDLSVDFAGQPIWSYADHRYQQGMSFPFVDSPQEMTAAAVQGVGFLLRDADWYPWPWTTYAQVGQAEDRVTISLEHSHSINEYNGQIPQLLATASPNRMPEGPVDSGRDTGAGVVRALAALERNAPRLWVRLGETTTPTAVALPYIPDVIANPETIAIPEAADLRNGVFLSPVYRAPRVPDVADRAATYVAARAWLNGGSLARSGFAPADWDTEPRAGDFPTSKLAPRAGTEYRLLRVPRIGVLRAPWSSIWLGADPNHYDVDPFALWLAIETADEQVKRDDLALLRGLGRNQQDVFDLRDRGLPWSLYMRLGTVRITLALVDWAEQIGSDAALRLFADTYREAQDHSHESILASLSAASGAHIETENQEVRQ
ncbi:MAG: hypothetical protein KF813_14210 [Trueperaceae bacterium]|nr:hypothetical protein [Trueperaceae bacterium]